MITLSNEKLNILEKFGIIPSGLNIPIDMKIIDVRASEYLYYGKNAENYECFTNYLLSIKIEHSQVEKSFWITIFEGATYRETDSRCIVASFDEIIDLNSNNTLEEGTLYDSDCITKDDENFDGIESIKEILSAFKYRLYEVDESGLYNNGENIPISHDNANFLRDCIYTIIDFSFENINIKISKENPNIQALRKIYQTLLEISSNIFYSVTTISNNEIEQNRNFLSKDEAEKLFKDECKKYCNDDAVNHYINESILDKNIDELNIAEWENYFGSSSWYDYNENFKVTISVM
ncbi:MAG: hypothetical protein PHE16_02935 [Aliarcobacter sp.]|nr:hypothetical protein [Aliarcobacter sp.]